MARPPALIPLRCVALRPLRDPLSSPSSSSLASPSPHAAAHLLLPSSCAQDGQRGRRLEHRVAPHLHGLLGGDAPALHRRRRGDAVGERGRSACSHRSALGRFEARASSVRPLAPPAGRVLQAWQRHPGATQLFYLSTPPRYARQSSCSSTSRALRASAPNHRRVPRTQRNA